MCLKLLQINSRETYDNLIGTDRELENPLYEVEL